MAGLRSITSASAGSTSAGMTASANGAPVLSDKAVIRAVHGSPDAPNVDIGVVADESIQTVLFSDLGYTKASDEKGLAADEGHIPIGVGAASSSTPAAVFTVPAAKGQRAFAVAAGALAPQSGQQSFRLLFVDTAQPTWTVTTVFPH